MLQEINLIFLRLTDSSENIKFSVEDDGKVFSAGDISVSGDGIFAVNISGSYPTSTVSFGLITNQLVIIYIKDLMRI